MHISRLLSFVSLTALAAPALAQPAASDGNTDIIVTAQRRAERLQDVPISMSVQSGETLAKAGVVDTRGLESLTPGLTMQQQSGFLQPALRGVSTSVVAPGAENPIAIYLDGVYVSSQNGSVISLPDVDRIEVLKGPQGTLFGRNATGGAIQIITKKPSFTPTGKISAIAGMFDGAGSSRSAYDFGVEGFVSGPLVPDKIAASIAFSQRVGNGYGTNIAYGRVSDALDRAYGSDRIGRNRDSLIRGKLLFTPSDNVDILLTGYYNRRHTDINNNGYIVLNATSAAAFPGAIYATKPWEYAFDAPRPDQLVKGHGASLKIDWTLDVGTITSTTAYSYTNVTEFVDTDGGYAPQCLATFACSAVRDQFVDKNVSQELVFSSRKFGGFSLVAGLFGYSSNSTSNVQVNDFPNGALPAAPEVVNPPIFFYDETVKTRAFGIFAEGTYELTDKLSVIAGIRYSYEKKTATIHFFGGPETQVADPHWDAFTPRVSVRYALDSHSNVYATYSKGFKSGVIPSGDPAAKPANPETLQAYEIGFKTARRGFSLNAAAFYYDYKNLQVQSNAGLGGAILIINNAATARMWGFDVDGTATLAPGLTVRGGVSWLPHADYRSYENAVGSVPIAIGNYLPGPNVIDLSGTRLYKTPKVTLSAGATYETQLGNGKLSISPNLYYASALFVEATHLVKTDNLRIGAEVVYEPENSNFRFTLWGKNLNNSHAFMSANVSNNEIALIPQAPREIGVTATYSF